MGKTNKFQLVKDLDLKQRLKFQLGLLPEDVVEKLKSTEKKKRMKIKPPRIESTNPNPKPAKVGKSKRKKVDGNGNTLNSELPKTLGDKDGSVKRKRRRRRKKASHPAEMEATSSVQQASSNLIKRKKEATDIKKEPRVKIAKIEPSIDENHPNTVNSNQKPTKTKSSKKTPTSLREKMTEKLKGARFRFINETLYTTTSTEAMQMFKEDPTAYQVYHEGYNMQKVQWPLDPLDLIIKQLKKLPADTIIVDMGCGEARLSTSISQMVYSFDLVALNEKVTACDMANVPLEDESVDICVYCLSLMGTNLSEYFAEANRILKPNGLVKIVEIATRFISKKDFRRSMEKVGFQLIKQTQPNDYFVQMDFEKIGKVTNKRPPGLNLKPCRYKKR